MPARISNRLLLAAAIASALAAVPLLIYAQTAPLTTPAPALTTQPDAKSQPANQLTLSTERVVVYKDGYALLIKSATATADAQGRVFTNQVPDAAVLGAFWALADQKNLALHAEWDESKSTRQRTINCLTTKDLLRANVGKKVTLTLDATGEKRSVSGTLSQILENPAPQQNLTPRISTVRGQTFAIETSTDRSPFEELQASGQLPASATGALQDVTLVRDTTPVGGDYIVIEGPDAGGKTILPSSRVLSVVGDNLATTTARTEEVFTRTKRLSVDFGKENANKPVALKLFYFTPGIRWIPTYRITGELKDKADIALQGELVNDLEDIADASVDLVVGVPNFRFKDAPSPLTLERTLVSTLNASFRNDNRASNLIFNGQMSNASFSNSHYVPTFVPPAAAPDLASGEQDLFVYPLQKTSIKRGARSTLPLWQLTTDLKHLYTYDVKNRRSRSTGSMITYTPTQPSDRSSPTQLTLNTIWHQLELVNSSKSPWTTGPALSLKGSLPLGQDLLTYTPPGSNACVPVTIAVDLRATTDEEEIERQNSALRVDGYDYSLIKKKGTVTLTSFRKEPSAMRITLSTGGKIEKVSDDGKTKINDFRPEDWDDQSYMRPNNHSDVTWEFTLEPGKTKTLTYTLSSYIR